MNASLRHENSTLVALQRLEALDVQRRAEDQARTAQHEQTTTILLDARNRNTRLFGVAAASSVLLALALLTLGWQQQRHSNQVASILDGFGEKRRTLERDHASSVADLQQALQAARTQVLPLPTAVSAAPAAIKRPVSQQAPAYESPVPTAKVPAVIRVPTFSQDPLDGLEGFSDGAETRHPPKPRSHRRGRR